MLRSMGANGVTAGRVKQRRAAEARDDVDRQLRVLMYEYASLREEAVKLATPSAAADSWVVIGVLLLSPIIQAAKIHYGWVLIALALVVSGVVYVRRVRQRRKAMKRLNLHLASVEGRVNALLSRDGSKSLEVLTWESGLARSRGWVAA